MKDLKVRVTSGVIGVGLLLLIFYLSYRMDSPVILDFAVTVLSIIGLKELFAAFENKGLRPMLKFSQALISLGFLFRLDKNIASLRGFFGLDKSEAIGFWIGLIVIILLLELLRQKRRVEDIGASLIGVLYLGFLFSHLAKINNIAHLGLVFIIAFGTDTFAYFGGNFFGRNKLCPSLSPNKTIEGSLVGVLGSVCLTVIYGLILGLEPLGSFVPLAIIGSIGSQCGDLVASSIKRDCGIKDYGDLIPGHGGVLDRFDSVIFTSPIIYYYLRLIIYRPL